MRGNLVNAVNVVNKTDKRTDSRTDYRGRGLGLSVLFVLALLILPGLVLAGF